MDHRYLARTANWWKSYDKRTRIVVVELADELKEELEDSEIITLINEEGCASFPFEFRVCSTCNGYGTHVNPSIDSHGITSEEWDRDWSYEDRENYMSGFYDVSCYECGGEKVVPEVVESSLSPAQKKLWNLIQRRCQEDASYAIERQREIEMGY
jgi:hypothetical protein